MTKSILFPCLFALFTLAAACTKTTIDPAETAQARQERQWLSAPAKWVVSEAREQGTVYFKRGINQVGDGDMQVEWLRFLGTNQLTVKLLGGPAASSLFYRIDGTTKELIVSPTADFAKPLPWNTRIDNIRETSIDLFITEGKDVHTLTLMPE